MMGFLVVSLSFLGIGHRQFTLRMMSFFVVMLATVSICYWQFTLRIDGILDSSLRRTQIPSLIDQMRMMDLLVVLLPIASVDHWKFTLRIEGTLDSSLDFSHDYLWMVAFIVVSCSIVGRVNWPLAIWIEGTLDGNLRCTAWMMGVFVFPFHTITAGHWRLTLRTELILHSNPGRSACDQFGMVGLRVECLIPLLSHTGSSHFRSKGQDVTAVVNCRNFSAWGVLLYWNL